MKKVINLLLIAAIAVPATCFGTDNAAIEKLLSVVNIKPEDATPGEVSGLLGKPSEIDDYKKQSVWHYNSGNTTLTIYWDSRDKSLERYSFTATPEKKAWDNNYARGLRTGQTKLAQAIEKLGAPRELLVKPVNQELHYAYQNTVLHLFFRNGTLVNYTLY